MEIYISGKKVLYDKEDDDIVKKYKWHISDTGYAVWRGVIDGEKKTIRLHRLIAKPQGDLVVDHINRNKLDNRRANLRCVTQAENVRNSEQVVNAKGYYYSNSKCRVNNKWVVDYRGYDCTFATEADAKKAVEQIRNGTFIKPKIIRHNICSRCGSRKQFYGKTWVCRSCDSRKHKEYYKRKKGLEYGKTKER